MLRHKTGLINRGRDFDAILSAKPLADPLSGNYTLFRECHLVTAFAVENNGAGSLCLQPITVTRGGAKPYDASLAQNYLPGVSAVQNAIYSTDLNGDGIDETVMVYTDATNNLWLNIFTYDTANACFKPGAPKALNIGTSNGSPVKLCGDVISVTDTNPQQGQNIIAAWVGSDNKVHIWAYAVTTDLAATTLA